MKNRAGLFIFPRVLAGLLLATALTSTVALKATAQTFANVPIADLPGVYQGKVAWGDYDNDGRLDFLITGLNGEGMSQLWRNTGNGFTNVPIAGLLLNTPDAVAWGDYDNDGWLDFLNTGYTSGDVPQLWRNTGSGFTNVSVAGLAGFQLGEVAWADYDRDGRLDFLITGYAASNPNRISQLWRNTGNGFTQVSIADLPGVWDSSVAWGDYDNDGWPDFLLLGRTATNGNITQLWRNTGDGFSNVTASVAVGLPQVMLGSAAWGDYDNDGRLDFLLMGDDKDTAVTQLWRNTGSGFTNVPIAGLPQLRYGAVAWGDYDNDGRLDFLLTGSGPSQLWRNTGSGFTNVPIAGLLQLDSSSVAWGDYDNDGRLDFLLMGLSSGGRVTQLWRNTTPVTNTPPTAPTGLTASGAADALTLSWHAASDAQTPTNGLSYNVRVGTTPGGTDLFAGHVNPTNGFRRVPALGNAGAHLSLTLNGLPNGLPIYWGVQAVDTAFAGGPFATNVIFPPSISAVNPPTGPTAGGIPILLTGTFFETNATVTIGGNSAPVVSVNSTNTQILCTLPAGQGTNVPVIVTSGGVASAAAYFTYDLPGITNVSPSIGPTAGGITVTLKGNNFGTSGTVTIGGNFAPVVTTNWSHTEIQCVLPEGQGVNQPVIVVSGGQPSPPANFNYAQPGITNVNPSVGPTVGGAVITLRGTNFGTSGTVSIGGKPAPVVTTNWSHTQIQCVLPPGQGLNQSVVVTTGGQPSPAANFNYGAPIITNVIPALVPTAGSNTITLHGTNFGVSGFLFVNGQFLSIVVTNWSDSEIKFLSPPGQGTNIPIFVITGGQMSPTTFYGYAPPGITNVSPPLGPEIGGITVTLRGTNFGTSGVVTVGTNGIPVTVSGWSHHQIQFTLPPGTGTNVPVVVTVGGQTSPSAGFNYFRPAITNVSPATGPTAGGGIITLKGMYFGTNGTVTIGGTDAPVVTTNWSDTQIQCTLPAGQGTNVPVIVNSDGQASLPASFSYFVPGILNVSPATGPTLGGTTITLTGTNFGTSGTVMLGGNFVPVAATNWSDTQIRFTLPMGQGTNVPLVVITAGQASAPAHFNYAAPSITSVNPPLGPEIGGITVTLTGADFGMSGSVTMGTNAAAIITTSWSDSQIQFTLPPGQGTNVPIVVVNSTGQSSLPASFTYFRPAITNVSPATGPTAGGITITLQGQYFGTNGTVTFAGNNVAATTNWTDTQIQFTLPAGQGTNVPVIVTSGGQSSAPASFSYFVPGITNVSPPTGPTAGGATITLTGTNFGTSGAVTMNGNIISVTATNWSDSQIRFTLPQGQGTNVPIVVLTAGQSSSAAYFKYAAPIITSINPTSAPTAGGTVLTITGVNFGTSGTVMVGNKPATTVFPGSEWTHNQIVCRIPSGGGESLPVVVTTEWQASNPFYFSYLRPTLTIATVTNGVRLAWPTNAPDYWPEESTSLSGVPWSFIPQGRTINGVEYNSVVPFAPTNTFFRLRKYLE